MHLLALALAASAWAGPNSRSFDSLLDSLGRGGAISACWGRDEGKKKLGNDGSLTLYGVPGRPSVSAAFLGAARDGRFEPEELRLTEHVDADRPSGRVDGYALSELEEGSRYYYSDLEGELDRVALDLRRTLKRQRRLGPGAEKDERIRRMLDEAMAVLGLDSFEAILARLEQENPESSRKYLNTPFVAQADGRERHLELSIVPKDDEAADLGRVFTLLIVHRSGSEEEGGKEEETWSCSYDLKSGESALARVLTTEAKAAREGAPSAEERRDFAALLAGYARQAAMDAMLGR